MSQYEIIQAALTCSSCHGSSFTNDLTPCPDCIDGIPAGMVAHMARSIAHNLENSYPEQRHHHAALMGLASIRRRAGGRTLDPVEIEHLRTATRVERMRFFSHRVEAEHEAMIEEELGPLVGWSEDVEDYIYVEQSTSGIFHVLDPADGVFLSRCHKFKKRAARKFAEQYLDTYTTLRWCKSCAPRTLWLPDLIKSQSSDGLDNPVLFQNS